jgi:hypothetical protein
MPAKKPQPQAPEATTQVTITAEDIHGALNLYGAGLFLNPATGGILVFSPVGMALARGLVYIADGDALWGYVVRQGHSYAAAAAQLTAELRMEMAVAA